MPLQGVRLSVFVSHPQAAWLRAEAKRLGLTVSELLRRYLDEKREPSERQPGK